jgi:hypothetical protein
VAHILAIGRFVTALLGAMAIWVAFAQIAAADIQGGCQAWAIGSKSGTVNLTSASELHLLQDDVLAVRGTAPRPQTRVALTLYAYGFGIQLPEFGGLRETDDSQSQIHVSTYSRYARVVVLSAATDDCTGSLLVSVDDLSPVRNAVGGAGAALGLLGLLGLLKAALGKGRIGSRIGGGLSGFLGGAGVSLLLQQMLWIDPRSTIGLIPVIAGLVLGMLLAGAIRRPPKPSAPAIEESALTPPPEAPVTAPTEGSAT